MRTIQVKLYKFEELSPKAKERAVEDWRSEDIEIHWADENRQTMEKFSDIFPIKVTNWSYGGRGEGVSFHFDCDNSDEIEELSGWRLASYLWNNYKDQLFPGKYYGRLVYTFPDGSPIPKSKEHPIGARHVKRYSHVILEHSCPLTGYSADDSILDPIYTFLDKPDSTTFKELLEDCFHEWIEYCNSDIEWQTSDEYISETLESNDYEFTEEGERQ